MSSLQNFNSIYPLVQSLYGIDPNEDTFEEIALAGWGLIGNKHTRLYRYVSSTSNRELELPCNVDMIESVNIPLTDAQITSNKTEFLNSDSIIVERYIDLWKRFDDPFYERGKYVKYKEGNNTLYFNRDYPVVKVVYQGIIADEEDGLPLINEKEKIAIATYVAYMELFKDSIKKRDGNILKLAQAIYGDWLKRCSAARIPEHLSQNDMNAILDVKHRWDRKQYSKSLKPIL